MLKAKILFVGPSESGKSVLANFLSESTEGISSYVPTQGVRILEYEKPNMNGNSKGAGCRFELWDCGGDQKFETCWPALMKDSHGVVIVFNPELPSHLKEIEMWYSCFVQQQQLLDSQCLIIAHHKPGSAGDTENLSLASPLNKLKLIHSSLEEDPEDVRMEFVKYFKSIINLLNESRDRKRCQLLPNPGRNTEVREIQYFFHYGICPIQETGINLHLWQMTVHKHLMSIFSQKQVDAQFKTLYENLLLTSDELLSQRVACKSRYLGNFSCLLALDEENKNIFSNKTLIWI